MATITEVLPAWQTQSGLLWSRLQTASTLEVAAIAAWYAIPSSSPTLRVAIAVLAGVLLLFVGLLAGRDSQYMDAIQKLPDKWLSTAQSLLGIKGRWLAAGIPVFLALTDGALAIGTALGKV